MKKHFKLYKAGKLWMTAALTILGAGLTTTMSTASVKADDSAVTAVISTKTSDQATSQSSSEEQNVGNTNKQADASVAAKEQETNNQAASGNNSSVSDKPTDNNQQGQDQPSDKLTQKDGKWYMGKDLATGMYPSDGVNYYFNNGEMQKNVVQEVNGIKYYFGNDGKASKAYVDGTGYFGNDGKFIQADPLYKQKDETYFYKGTLAKGLVTLDNGSSYYFDNGKKLTGIQNVNGVNYYFNPDNDGKAGTGYVQGKDGKWYYFGNDGKQQSVDALVLQNGKYMYQGKLANGYIPTKEGAYYFKDGVKQKGIIDDTANNMKYYMDENGNGTQGYVQDKDGYWYMFDKGGKIVSGAYSWFGSLYYFDPVTHLRVDNDYRATEKDGRGLLLGSDGIALTGVQKWYGTYYAFDYKTHLRVDNSFFKSQWGITYYFKDNGQIASGLTNINGDLYYFDPSTYMMVTNNYVATEKDGRGVLLGADGKALTGLQKWYGTYYYFDPVTHLRVDNEYRQQVWEDGSSDWYMFGKDGRIVTGFYNWMGSLYYFNPVTYLKVTNHYIKWGNDLYSAMSDGRVFKVNVDPETKRIILQNYFN